MRKDLNRSTPDTRLYSEAEQGLSHGALTAYGMIIPPSTARRTRTNCGSHGTRGQHLGKDLLPLRSAATPASCAGDLMKGDAGWQLADSPTPAGVLTWRSPAIRVTSGLRPPPSGHGHSTKHLIWQLPSSLAMQSAMTEAIIEGVLGVADQRGDPHLKPLQRPWMM